MITYFVSPMSSKLDCLIIPVFEEKGLGQYAKLFDKEHNGLLSDVIESKDFEGKKSQTSLIYTKDKDIPRVLLVGLGKEKDITIKKYKEAVGMGIVMCQNKKMEKLGVVTSQYFIKKYGGKKVASDMTSAIEIAAYAYDEHKTEKDAKITKLKRVEFVGDFNTSTKRSLEKGIEEGQIIARGVNFARQLGNTPPTIMTPTYLASQTQKEFKSIPKLNVKVLGKAEITKLGMGCLLAVARGSEHEPRFIIAEYWGTDKKKKPTVLVGKGITFDSGGLSIKPGQYMIDMKFDMLGAASVLGTVKAAAELKLKKNIIALVPAAENMPSGTAFRPDDILKAMNGKTVEVLNTDAEGRLVLADGLSYASQYKPREVIDLATLTGACMAALGLERSGIFTDEEKMYEKLSRVSDSVGEQLWRLPLGEEYSEAMKSEIADIKNLGGVGGERYGTASTAAAFLQEFTDYPWAHIDLASAIYGSKGRPWIRAGANGFGVQTLVEYLR
ncbi:leucyl aminopeptidase [Candidatus Parcubacteria bacterium]|nr:MAG: leucyl aminopeptidase [Candidatus Parcubacteria bacterium]